MHYNVGRAAHLITSGQVKYVLFDLDGTLYESRAGIEAQLRGAMVAQAAIALGVSQDESRALLRKYRGLYKASVLGLREHHGIDPVTFYEDVYGSLDVSKMEQRPGCQDARIASSWYLRFLNLPPVIELGVLTSSSSTSAYSS